MDVRFIYTLFCYLAQYFRSKVLDSLPKNPVFNLERRVSKQEANMYDQFNILVTLRLNTFIEYSLYYGWIHEFK